MTARLTLPLKDNEKPLVEEEIDNSSDENNDENKVIKKQFKIAEQYRKANSSSNKDGQLTTHPQAIYTSRLLNPFTKNLHSVEVIDFTK